jgi:transcriptional regulator with XRE-family HTH domain
METVKSDKSPLEGCKPDKPLPIPAQRTLKKLGEDINRARRRRGLTQQALAERAGAGLNTIKRLEAGDPRMQLHVLARVLHLFGELGRLSELLDSGQDDIGLALMDEQLPQRVRARKKKTSAF